MSSFNYVFVRSLGSLTLAFSRLTCGRSVTISIAVTGSLADVNGSIFSFRSSTTFLDTLNGGNVSEDLIVCNFGVPLALGSVSMGSA